MVGAALPALVSALPALLPRMPPLLGSLAVQLRPPAVQWPSVPGPLTAELPLADLATDAAVAAVAPTPIEATPAAAVHSSPVYALASVCSLLFRAIGFAGLLVLLSSVALPALTGAPAPTLMQTTLATRPGASLVLVWLWVEGAFYSFCMLWAGTKSRGRRRGLPKLDSARRQELWTRILNDPTQDTQKFVESWFFFTRGEKRIVHGGAWTALWGFFCSSFLGANVRAPRFGGIQYEQLRRADVLEWLAGGLFEKRLGSLTSAEFGELDELVAQLEAKVGSPLRDPLGHEPSPGLKAMNLAMDPIQWLHRPLAYYLLTHALYGEVITPLTFAKAGFERRSADGLTYYVRGANHGAVLERTDAAIDAKLAPRAIVFIHGVGVGPGPYSALLEQVATRAAEDDTNEATLFIALQVDEFCQRVAPGRPATPDRFAQQFEAVLDAHGASSAMVVGHSLGTAYARYISTRVTDRVAAVALIDPICCMLHNSRLTEAFVYQPVGPSVGVAAEEYYIRRELFTSNVLARHFQWHQAALWPTDCLPTTPTLLILSENDKIVPVEEIRACATTWNARVRGVRTLCLPGLGHGGWITSPDDATEISHRLYDLAITGFAIPKVPNLSIKMPKLPSFEREASTREVSNVDVTRMDI